MGVPGQGTCVGAWNLAALGASGVVLLSVADDFHPPVAWDDKVLSRTPLDVPAVLMINDRLSSCRSMVSDDTDDDMDQAKQEHGIGKEGAWWTVKVRRDVTPHAYGVLQSHPVLNRERYQQVFRFCFQAMMCSQMAALLSFRLLRSAGWVRPVSGIRECVSHPFRSRAIAISHRCVLR